MFILQKYNRLLRRLACESRMLRICHKAYVVAHGVGRVFKSELRFQNAQDRLIKLRFLQLSVLHRFLVLQPGMNGQGHFHIHAGAESLCRDGPRRL